MNYWKELAGLAVGTAAAAALGYYYYTTPTQDPKTMENAEMEKKKDHLAVAQEEEQPDVTVEQNTVPVVDNVEKDYTPSDTDVPIPVKASGEEQTEVPPGTAAEQFSSYLPGQPDAEAVTLDQRTVPVVNTDQSNVPVVALEQITVPAATENEKSNLSNLPGDSSFEQRNKVIPEAPVGFIMLTLSEFQFLQDELKNLKERIEEVVECGGDIAETVEFTQDQTDEVTRGLYEDLVVVNEKMSQQDKDILYLKNQMEEHLDSFVGRINNLTIMVNEHGAMLSKLEWLHNPKPSVKDYDLAESDSWLDKQ